MIMTMMMMIYDDDAGGGVVGGDENDGAGRCYASRLLAGLSVRSSGRVHLTCSHCGVSP